MNLKNKEAHGASLFLSSYGRDMSTVSPARTLKSAFKTGTPRGPRGLTFRNNNKGLQIRPFNYTEAVTEQTGNFNEFAPIHNLIKPVEPLSINDPRRNGPSGAYRYGNSYYNRSNGHYFEKNNAAKLHANLQRRRGDPLEAAQNAEALAAQAQQRRKGPATAQAQAQAPGFFARIGKAFSFGSQPPVLAHGGKTRRHKKSKSRTRRHK